jgi:pilus assembly protein CpaF
MTQLPEEKQSIFLVTDEYNEMKGKVHDRLIELLDLSLIDSMDRNILRQEVRRLTDRILSEVQFNMPLNYDERDRFHREIFDEIHGLGPIEPLMHDPTVSDVLVNSYQRVYVERFGKLHLTSVRFKDDNHLKRIIDRIVSAVGRRIDESSPMVDARLPDGSRVNAIIPPIAVDGPSLSIRRFAVDPLEMEDLLALKTIVPEIAQILQEIVKARLNIIVAGGTGSGKTTFLNVLSRFVPSNERVVTIEDSAELQLKQEHVVRLETRPPNIEGKGEITQRDLVRNSLRMRPDRIILGEVRAGEVIDMLQAMNTGHDGSLTTIHANSPRDALLRLETLVAMSGLNIPNEAVKRYISSAINVIIHVARMVDGSRKMVSFQEITGMEGNVITMQEICAFEQKGIDDQGHIKGRFVMKGILPKFIEKLNALGIKLPREIFDGSRSFEV